jgi:hypothetical protein
VIALLAWLLVRLRVPVSVGWGIGLLMLVVLQPAWWFPANMGDCGGMRAITGGGTALLSILVLIAGILRARRALVLDRAAGV